MSEVSPKSMAMVLDVVATAALSPHPLNAKVFAEARGDEERELLEDIRRNGIRRSIVACGNGCASPRGTLLAGHRRWRAAQALGMATIEVVLRDDLSPDEEEWELLLDNRRDQRSRQLRHSELFAMEDRLRALHGKRQGQRSDLTGGTSVTRDRSSEPRRTTNLVLAGITGEAASAIKNRRTVFTSPFVADRVRTEVDTGEVSLTRAASAVRRVMCDPVAQAAYETRDAVELGKMQDRLEKELHATREPKAPTWVVFVKRALHDLESGDPSRAGAGLLELLAHAGHEVQA